MKYYKLVTADLRSWVDSPGSIQYIKGQFVKAPQQYLEKGYGLCVFNSLIQAKRQTNLGNRIFECKVRGVFKELPPRLHFHDFTPYTENFEWFEGTRMCSEVKLTKEVTSE
jgi:hypothetical protein